jgi:Undecaprenyl-phosphate glucose phosphotransferase
VVYLGTVKKQHQFIQFFFVLLDILAVAAAWLLSYMLRFSGSLIPIYRGIPPFSLYAMLTLVVVPVWIAFFRINRLYDLKRGESRIEEFFHLVKGGSMATVFLVAGTFFYREYTFSRAVILLFWVTALVFCAILRTVLHRILKRMRERGINVNRILIVGTGDLAGLVGEKLLLYPGLGLRLEGYVNAGNGEECCPQCRDLVLGATGELVPLIRERRIDQVIIALPRDAHITLAAVLKLLENETVDIKVVPDVLQFALIKTGLEELDGIPIINLCDTPLSGWVSHVKRLADVVVALGVLVVAFPLMLLIALLVKLTSPGPVFFRQERMGLDGTIFSMLKFRSMRQDAERETGAVWARENDPRRTRLGSFLRRTSLDELPQLFNVLKGEMSIVGPRPERPVFVVQFREKIPRYMLRHKVKSGLTGWAQVNGLRGNTSLEKRIEYDMYYIENWSLAFDLRILWLTLWKGFIHRNAY